MKKYLHVITGISLALLSCEKKENNEDIIPGSNDAENSNITTVVMKYNPYFPLDTNDIWIYNVKTTIYDDVDDSINDNNIESRLDTVSSGKISLNGNVYVQAFNGNLYNTQTDKISLVIDSSGNYKKQHIIDILFTESNDTSWTDTISHKIYGNQTIQFSQQKVKNNNSDQIDLSITNGFMINIGDRYTFQKDIGIIKSTLSGINISTDINLIKHVNN